jgi:hypothetical protein
LALCEHAKAADKKIKPIKDTGQRFIDQPFRPRSGANAASITQDYHPTIVNNSKLLILQPRKAWFRGLQKI